MAKIGVLSLQGDVLEHERALRAVGVSNVIRVKATDDLDDVDGIILPGGESTVMGRLAKHKAGSLRETLLTQLASKISDGFPTLATCAGVILLAREVTDRVLGDTGQATLGCLDLVVTRNSYGRQQESFEAPVALQSMPGLPTFDGVFIRAPTIDSFGPDSTILGRLGESVVALQQKNVILTTFHPELTTDTRFHNLLLNAV